jgi:SAM-dependent methyltransferase
MSEEAPGPVAPKAYWEERLRERPDLDGVGVTRLGPGFNRWAYRVRGANFERALRPLLAERAPERVLDIGSGTGFYLDRWARLGARELVAADLTETAVAALSRSRPGLQVHRLDIGDPDAIAAAGLESASFDYVSAIDVLFHILDDERYRRAFANVATLLRPGGAFVFSEDLVPARRARRRRIKTTRSRRQSGRAWRAAGLRAVTVAPLLHLMNFPSAGDRRARRRFARLQRLAGGRPRLAALIGALLYPLERRLTAARSETPSTKLVICRKEGP